MPQYLRWKSDGSTYFFTLVMHGRRPWFRSSTHRRLLGASFREARRRMPYEIDAAVLLPDHLHIVMRPSIGVDYSALLRLIKTLFTKRVIRRLAPGDKALASRRPGERSVWQRRFFEHTIRDEVDWSRHVEYVHFNPVKHELARAPEDWPWSSFHRYVRLGWLEPDWPGRSRLNLPNLDE